MWITVQRPAFLRRLFLPLLLAAVGGACGDKEGSKGSSTSSGSAESKSKSTEAGEKPAGETPDLASIDVSFLVEPCVDSGESEEKCRCAGEEAKTIIGPKILAKMSKAPADDDPAIQKYYSVLEMQQIMNWVNDAGVKCGIEEEE